MDTTLQQFVESSDTARRIVLPTHVVLHRSHLTPRDLLDIREAERYEPQAGGESLCELSVGGKAVARGRIVRRRGDYYFKVVQVIEDPPSAPSRREETP